MWHCINFKTYKFIHSQRHTQNYVYQLLCEQFVGYSSFWVVCPIDILLYYRKRVYYFEEGKKWKISSTHNWISLLQQSVLKTNICQARPGSWLSTPNLPQDTCRWVAAHPVGGQGRQNRLRGRVPCGRQVSLSAPREVRLWKTEMMREDFRKEMLEWR